MEPAAFDLIPEDVLIVEDDLLIALDFEDTIIGFGAKTVRTAERLEALKIPFVFVTGYGTNGAFPPAFAGKPILHKPCSAEALRAVLRRRSEDGAGR